MISNIFLQTCLVLGTVASDASYDEFRLETVSRTYRITVYNEYHTEREQFDRLQELGHEAASKWKLANHTERVQILRWFESSTLAIVNGQVSQAEKLDTPPSGQSVVSDTEVVNGAVANETVANETVDNAIVTSPVQDDIIPAPPGDVEPADAEVDSTNEFEGENVSQFTSVLDSVSRALTGVVGGTADEDGEDKEVPVDIDITGPADEVDHADFAAPDQESGDNQAVESGQSSTPSNVLDKLALRLAADSVDVQELSSIVEKTEEIYWRQALLAVQSNADNSTEVDAKFAELLSNLQARVTTLGAGEEQKELLDRISELTTDE